MQPNRPQFDDGEPGPEAGNPRTGRQPGLNGRAGPQDGAPPYQAGPYQDQAAPYQASPGAPGDNRPGVGGMAQAGHQWASNDFDQAIQGNGGHDRFQRRPGGRGPAPGPAPGLNGMPGVMNQGPGSGPNPMANPMAQGFNRGSGPGPMPAHNPNNGGPHEWRPEPSRDGGMGGGPGGSQNVNHDMGGPSLGMRPMGNQGMDPGNPYPNYDTGGQYDPFDDYQPDGLHGGQGAPAMLAARAEPLGGGRPPGRGRMGAPGPNRQGPGPGPARSGGGPRRSNKPTEPSKMVLGIGMAVVVLVGAVAVWLLTRNNGEEVTTADGADLVDDGAGTDQVIDPTTDTGAIDPASQQPAETAVLNPQDVPDVEFDEAAVGPVESGVPYQLGVQNAPADASMYQVLIDDVPQGEPAPQIPPITFQPGYHLVQINITSGAGLVPSKKVVVYALGPTPEPTYRANLASVNIVDQGWANAVEQFTAFRDAGHDQVELYPSDRIPGLTPGFWNIFVGGFDSLESANNYCVERGLELGVSCFAKLADPNSAPSG